jgi:hypothetical protein
MLLSPPPSASMLFWAEETRYDSMKNPIELLFNLQGLELGLHPNSDPQADEILRLRQKIPGPILAHYDASP